MGLNVPHLTQPARRRSGLLGCLLACLLFLSGCGGSKGSSAPATADSSKHLPEDTTRPVECSVNDRATQGVDPLLSTQWHLTSLNIPDADKGFFGQCVVVAVVDDGMDIHHEDLINNAPLGSSYNFQNRSHDPSPNSNHGTAVAGVIAAEAFNEKGGRGIAPLAQLQGFNLINLGGASFIQGWYETHGGSRTTQALVINESYGVSASGPQNYQTNSEHQAFESHLKRAMRTNNQGRGMFISKAAGNAFQIVDDFAWQQKNYRYKGDKITALVSLHARQPNHYPKLSANIAGTELESSSFYHTVISALNNQDVLANYSSVGPSVWFAAPAGGENKNLVAITTTAPDSSYTDRFNGTSAATPMASGVAALLFAANEQLTWRDVRHIMLSTATQIEEDFAAIKLANNFEAVPAWLTNAAGYKFHHWYGFGKINAAAALNMALDNYAPLPPVQEINSISGMPLSSIKIPNDAKESAKKTFAVNNELTVETVQVRFSAKHERDADLAIELISPSGTRSMLLQPQSLLVEDLMDGYSTTEFTHTVLQSNAFYGEPANGPWTLKVTDTNQGDFKFWATSKEEPTSSEDFWEISHSDPTSEATLGNVYLTIYGHQP